MMGGVRREVLDRLFVVAGMAIVGMGSYSMLKQSERAPDGVQRGSREQACYTAALKSYSAAVVADFDRGASSPIEALASHAVTRRRLQERLCAQYSECTHPSQPAQISVSFAACLRDEEASQD